MSRELFRRVAGLAAIAVVSASQCLAQTTCRPEWLPVVPNTGTMGAQNYVLHQTLWDPDGTGPEAEKLLVGGLMLGAGKNVVNSLATYDAATSSWNSVGGGVTRRSTMNELFRVPGTVLDSMVLPNGNLVVAGFFDFAGDVRAPSIAEWDGTNWRSLGFHGWEPTSNSSPFIYSLALWDRDGSGPGTVELLAAAASTLNPGAGVFSYDVSTGAWSVLGAMPSGSVNQVHRLFVDRSGALIVGGNFPSIHGRAARNVATYVNGAWAPLGTGRPHSVWAFCEDAQGRLLAGGSGTTSATSDPFARWDGTTWEKLGADVRVANSGSELGIRELRLLSTGEVLVGGAFTVNSEPCIAKWKDGVWTSLATRSASSVLQPCVESLLELRNGDIIAGGNVLTNFEGDIVWPIARFDGDRWNALDDGTEGTVRELQPLPDGQLLVIGSYLTNSEPINFIRVYQDGEFHDFEPDARIFETGVSATGQIAAFGSFDNIRSMALLEGSNWRTLGGVFSTSSFVNAIQFLPNGNIVAAGTFTAIGGEAFNRVAEWDGAAWRDMGGGFNGTVNDLIMLEDGTLIAGGSFTLASGATAQGLASWNGSAWTELTPNPWNVLDMELLPDGRFLFAAPDGIYSFDSALSQPRLGGALSSLGTVQAFTRLADASVIVGGQTSDNRRGFMARWDGMNWETLTTGIQSIFPNSIADIEQASDGTILVATGAHVVEDIISTGLFRFRLPSACVLCDSIDFNGNGIAPESQDLMDLVLVFSGGACPTSKCNDLDFNNDGVFPDNQDLFDFIFVFGGGACPNQ